MPAPALRSSAVVCPEIPLAPSSVQMLCCHRFGPPPLFERLSNRNKDWSPSLDTSTGVWTAHWSCPGCGSDVDINHQVLHDINDPPPCPGGCARQLVVDRAAELRRWVCTPSCSLHAGFSVPPQQVSISSGLPPFFRGGPLCSLSLLYGWDSPPLSIPGRGTQSWLLMPLIS